MLSGVCTLCIPKITSGAFSSSTYHLITLSTVNSFYFSHVSKLILYLVVILIFGSLIFNNIKYLLLCIWHFWSYFHKWLLKLFAYFYCIISPFVMNYWCSLCSDITHIYILQIYIMYIKLYIIYNIIFITYIYYIYITNFCPIESFLFIFLHHFLKSR